MKSYPEQREGNRKRSTIYYTWSVLALVALVASIILAACSLRKEPLPPSGSMSDVDTTHFTNLSITTDLTVGDDVTVTDDLTISGDFSLGDGTPTISQAGEDAYIEGTFEVDGIAYFDGGIDLVAAMLDLDADNDTSITADTDDQIDIEIAGADDFQLTANTLTPLAGSKIVPQSATNASALFVAEASHTHALTETAVTMFVIPANANVVDVMYVITTQWNDGTGAVVNCGISGGDVDAFVDNHNINDAADINRMGDNADMPYATSLVDVGLGNATIICQVAETDDDASAGAATLRIWYYFD